MTKIKTVNDKDYEINDIDTLHPYSFDTRLVPHVHALDGSIIRLDTKEQFNGKTKVKTLTDAEIKTLTVKEDAKLV